MSTPNPRIAIVGAPGLVGRTALSVLEGRRWCSDAPVLMAATESADRWLPFRHEKLQVRPYSPDQLQGIDAVLLCAGARFADQHGLELVAAGHWVVDTSSRWRTDPRIPLIVPPVNGELLMAAAVTGPGSPRLIANPNCTAAIAAVALKPLCASHRPSRISLCSYQSASGGGRALLEQLDAPTHGGSGAGEAGLQLHENVLPRIGELDDHGDSGEETKITFELRRLLGLDDTPIVTTAVRVSTRVGHGMALSLWFDSPPSVEEARALLTAGEALSLSAIRPPRSPSATRPPPGSPTPGAEQPPGSPVLEYWPGERGEPTPRDAAGRDPVLVGRLRRPAGDPNALSLWVAGDNLRRGGALNAVEILERVLGLDAG